MGPIEEPPHYRADREIARTLAARIIVEWIKEDRSPTVMGLTVLRLHALLLSGVPPQERTEGIDRYVDALDVMLVEIDTTGP